MKEPVKPTLPVEPDKRHYAYRDKKCDTEFCLNGRSVQSLLDYLKDKDLSSILIRANCHEEFELYENEEKSIRLL